MQFLVNELVSEWEIYDMTWHYNKTNHVDIVFLGKKSLQEFRVNSQKQQQQKNVS